MTSTSTPVSCEEYEDFPFNPLPIEDLGKNIYVPSHNLFDIRSLCFFRTSHPEPPGRRLGRRQVAEEKGYRTDLLFHGRNVPLSFLILSDR
jgi:hypothetical protein